MIVTYLISPFVVKNNLWESTNRQATQFSGFYWTRNISDSDKSSPHNDRLVSVHAIIECGAAGVHNHTITTPLNEGYQSECLKKTNKMHFSFLIYSNNLSSTCFEQSNYSSSGGSYCTCSICDLPCWKKI